MTNYKFTIILQRTNILSIGINFQDLKKEKPHFTLLLFISRSYFVQTNMIKNSTRIRFLSPFDIERN